jgi:hypothetical protein
MGERITYCVGEREIHGFDGVDLCWMSSGVAKSEEHLFLRGCDGSSSMKRLTAVVGDIPVSFIEAAGRRKVPPFSLRSTSG